MRQLPYEGVAECLRLAPLRIAARKAARRVDLTGQPRGNMRKLLAD